MKLAKTCNICYVKMPGQMNDVEKLSLKLEPIH